MDSPIETYWYHYWLCWFQIPREVATSRPRISVLRLLRRWASARYRDRYSLLCLLCNRCLHPRSWEHEANTTSTGSTLAKYHSLNWQRKSLSWIKNALPVVTTILHWEGACFSASFSVRWSELATQVLASSICYPALCFSHWSSIGDQRRGGCTSRVAEHISYKWS